MGKLNDRFSEITTVNIDELVEFIKDIDGDITFLTEVRAKNGYLLVFDVWRQKKARSRRRPDAAKKLPRAYAQNDPPRNELSTISHKPDEKSSGGELNKSLTNSGGIHWRTERKSVENSRLFYIDKMYYMV